MVNQGRSRGCFTCRNRKVKCDEARPTCDRCRRARIECAGYEPRYPIVVEEPQQYRDTSVGSSREDSMSNFVPTRTSTSNLSPSHDASAQTDFQIQVPPEFNLRAFCTSIYRSFLAHNLIGRSEYCQSLLLIPPNRYILHEKSLDALAERYFGQFHYKDDISGRSRRPYVEALGSLASSLMPGQPTLDIYTILSTKALCFYEKIADEGFNNFLIHCGGIARMIEARGPESFQSSLELKVFEAIRASLIAASIAQEQRSFLEQRDWLATPWAQRQGPKPMMQQLMDLVCYIPGFLEDMNRIFKNSTDQEPNTIEQQQMSQLLELRGRVLDHLAIVQDWHLRWTRVFPQAYNSFTASSDSLDYPEHLFGQATKFSHLDRCIEWIAYQCLLLRLHFHIIRPLDEKLAKSFDATMTSDFLRPTLDAAVSVCRCVPYLLSFQFNGSAGAYVLQWYLHLVSGCYSLHSEEVAWLLRVVEACNKLGVRGMAGVQMPTQESQRSQFGLPMQPY